MLVVVIAFDLFALAFALNNYTLPKLKQENSKQYLSNIINKVLPHFWIKKVMKDVSQSSKAASEVSSYVFKCSY